MKKSEYLFQFFGGCFHQDWTLEASSPDEAIIKFLKNGYDMNSKDRLLSEINTYLRCAKNDLSIEQDLSKEFRCEYMPSYDGIGARQWLIHVVELIINSKLT